jgi:hypothetical protein
MSPPVQGRTSDVDALMHRYAVPDDVIAASVTSRIADSSTQTEL